MNRHLVRWLLALYPARWRDRYGPEVAGLNQELLDHGETTLLRSAWGLVSGAAVERSRMMGRSRRALLAMSAAAVLALAGAAVAEAGVPGLAAGGAATLTCLTAKPPVAATSHGQARATRPDGAGSRQAGHGPSCPDGQLSLVRHGSTGLSKARALRRPSQAGTR